MAGFGSRLLRRRAKLTSSADKAKERLQFILLHDRVNLPPGQLQSMKEEILEVISKYLAVTGSNIEIAFKQQDRDSNMLIAEIPFIKGLHPQSIDPNSEISDEEDQD